MISALLPRRPVARGTSAPDAGEGGGVKGCAVPVIPHICAKLAERGLDDHHHDRLDHGPRTLFSP